MCINVTMKVKMNQHQNKAQSSQCPGNDTWAVTYSETSARTSIVSAQ
jgi:hypothetical protein